jgi:hypothetical protein
MSFMGHVTCGWVLVGNPEGRRPLRIPRHRWEVNIKIIQEVGWVDMDWIDLAEEWDRWQELLNGRNFSAS